MASTLRNWLGQRRHGRVEVAEFAHLRFATRGTMGGLRQVVIPVTVVNVSVAGCAVRLPGYVDLEIDQKVEVGLSDHWGEARVAWGRIAVNHQQPALGETVVCGLEFLTMPAELSGTIEDWVTLHGSNLADEINFEATQGGRARATR